MKIYTREELEVMSLQQLKDIAEEVKLIEGVVADRRRKSSWIDAILEHQESAKPTTKEQPATEVTPFFKITNRQNSTFEVGQQVALKTCPDLPVGIVTEVLDDGFMGHDNSVMVSLASGCEGFSTRWLVPFIPSPPPPPLTKRQKQIFLQSFWVGSDGEDLRFMQSDIFKEAYKGWSIYFADQSELNVCAGLGLYRPGDGRYWWSGDISDGLFVDERYYPDQESLNDEVILKYAKKLIDRLETAAELPALVGGAA